METFRTEYTFDARSAESWMVKSGEQLLQSTCYIYLWSAERNEYIVSLFRSHLLSAIEKVLFHNYVSPVLSVFIETFRRRIYGGAGKLNFIRPKSVPSRSKLGVLWPTQFGMCFWHSKCSNKPIRNKWRLEWMVKWCALSAELNSTLLLVYVSSSSPIASLSRQTRMHYERRKHSQSPHKNFNWKAKERNRRNRIINVSPSVRMHTSFHAVLLNCFFAALCSAQLPISDR